MGTKKVVRIIRLPTTAISKPKKIVIGNRCPSRFSLSVSSSTDLYIGKRLLFSFRRGSIPNTRFLGLLETIVKKHYLDSSYRKMAGGTRHNQSGVFGYYDKLTPQMKTVLKRNQAGRATAFVSNHPNN